MSLSCHISYYFLVGIEFDIKLEHYLTSKCCFQMFNHKQSIIVSQHCDNLHIIGCFISSGYGSYIQIQRYTCVSCLFS